VDPGRIRSKLAAAAPNLWKQLAELARRWTAPIVPRLERRSSYEHFPKTVNDPVWGTIELYPWEVALIDSPLLQRLRGVRQLGLAHYVYPSAVHDRLEHSIGVVEAASRIIRSLVHNAKHRRKFGTDADDTIPTPDDFDLDVVSTRLGALLHDIGHSPFSHATEAIVGERFAAEFVEVGAVLREEFEGVTKIATAEMVAVLLVFSEPLREVFEHPRFGASAEPAELAPAITARILGSRSCLKATYLSGVVSGPLDADKLDYMARDSHHSGLKLGLDINRLISKLEVVTVTPENAPNPELRDRAQSAPYGRIHDIGISLAGLGAYEQMIFGRVFLYDRIYFHHKVRAAEAMVRRLIVLAEEERRRQFELAELYHDGSDDSFINVLGGMLTAQGVTPGKDRSEVLARSIRYRDVYGRAYAFAARNIAGLADLAPEEQRETRALLWTMMLSDLRTEEGRGRLAQEIYGKACALVGSIPELAGGQLQPEHVLVDVPPNKTVSHKGDILTRSHSGHVGTPNLYFNAERWSQAYEHQKQCGYVFAPREFLPLVSLAARVVFFERYQVVMTAAAEQASKCAGLVRAEWIEAAAEKGQSSAECREALRNERSRLVSFRADDIPLPEAWRKADPVLAAKLAASFRDALPAGLPASVHKRVKDVLPHLASFLDMAAKDGLFAGCEKLLEKDFQAEVRRHLRSREVDTLDGAEFGGGETDLVLFRDVVVENKVAGDVANPMASGPHYAWQARRYAMAICSRVTFVLLAYRPSSEKAHLPAYQRISVSPIEGAPDGHVQVRLAVPWGYPVPHDAKKPNAPSSPDAPVAAVN
jgi:HD superfamily phosphohydrolase